MTRIRTEVTLSNNTKPCSLMQKKTIKNLTSLSCCPLAHGITINMTSLSAQNLSVVCDLVLTDDEATWSSLTSSFECSL